MITNYSCASITIQNIECFILFYAYHLQSDEICSRYCFQDYFHSTNIRVLAKSLYKIFDFT